MANLRRSLAHFRYSYAIVCSTHLAPKRKRGLAARQTGRVQLGQRAALYCRVSTADQSGSRQERDLTAFAGRAGYEVVGIIKETGSGVRLDLIQERIRSGIAAAKARGKRPGRQPGQRPKPDRLTPKVIALVGIGRSYRLVGRELGLSKNTVTDIVRRNRDALGGIAPTNIANRHARNAL